MTLFLPISKVAEQRFMKESRIISDTQCRSAWIRKAWIESGNRREPGRALRADEEFTLNVELYVAPGQRVELIASFHDQHRRPLWTSLNSSRSRVSFGPGPRILIKPHFVFPPLPSARWVSDWATAGASRYP